jgi:hypothetical protein
MAGGTISGNSAASGKEGAGGSVQVGEEAVFTMTDGAITGNNISTSVRKQPQGSGVRVWKGTFSVSGGEITDNSTTGNGRALGPIHTRRNQRTNGDKAQSKINK